MGLGGLSLSLWGCSTGPARRFSSNAAIAVFREIESRIDDAHYLAGSGTPNWIAWRGAAAEVKRRIGSATSWRELYFQMLVPSVQALRDSHTYLMPPAWLTDEEAPVRPSAPEAAVSPAAETAPAPAGPPWRGDISAGLGFRMAPQPHGQMVVYGVVAGSPADVNGVEPGSTLNHFTFAPQGSAPPIFFGSITTPGGETRTVRYALETKEAAPEFAEEARAGGIHYVRFDRFTADNVQAVIQSLSGSGMPWVLDLRLNIGGDLPALQQLLGALLGEGVEIGTLMSARASERIFTAGPRSVQRPGAVLVGPGTQSAAEVAADVLKYYKRATLVGAATSGQVLASDGFALRDGAVLRVAIRNFIAVSGDSLEQRGVNPQERVETTLADVRAGGDPPYERGARILGADQ